MPLIPRQKKRKERINNGLKKHEKSAWGLVIE